MLRDTPANRVRQASSVRTQAMARAPAMEGKKQCALKWRGPQDSYQLSDGTLYLGNAPATKKVDEETGNWHVRSNFQYLAQT